GAVPREGNASRRRAWCARNRQSRRVLRNRHRESRRRQARRGLECIRLPHVLSRDRVDRGGASNVTLAPGTRLGPHEIVGPLGAGGMGEVYRATDTRLKRHVAIKILPVELAADTDRLARFQREAEVLASLNHPHVAAIYGVEEQAGVTALVMELVE